MGHPLNTLKDDTRGVTADAAVTVVVALAVTGLVAGVLLPVALNELQQDQSSSFTGVNEGETVNVSTQLNATLDTVDDTNSELDITVTDRDTGSSTTFTGVAVGTNTTQTLEGEDITVTADGITDSTTANFTVEYPPEYGMSTGASSLWNILDLAIVLVVFLFLVGYAYTRI